MKRIGLFGSFVRGQARRSSDVDLLAEFDGACKTYENYSGAVHFLEDLLGRPVELLTREGLSPFIGPQILMELEDVPLAP